METENKEMIEVGTIVPCIVPGGKIASWRRQVDGSIFCKISMEITISPRWVAVENPYYRSKGLIIFIDRRPDFEEEIRIVKTGKNYAVGKVVSQTILKP